LFASITFKFQRQLFKTKPQKQILSTKNVSSKFLLNVGFIYYVEETGIPLGVTKKEHSFMV
jgi:hypothetical protein